MARAEQLAQAGELFGEGIKYVVPKAVAPGKFVFRVLLPRFTREEEAAGFREVPPEDRVVAVVTVTAEELLDPRLFQRATLTQLGMCFGVEGVFEAARPWSERVKEWRLAVEEALLGAPLYGVEKEEAWRAKGVLFLEPPVEAPAAPKKRQRRAPADDDATPPN
jgi:hypothetical protein